MRMIPMMKKKKVVQAKIIIGVISRISKMKKTQMMKMRLINFRMRKKRKKKRKKKIAKGDIRN
jgi:hypothetical protein